MSEEEKDNAFKIKVPIFTTEELRELDCIIENDTDNIINQISKKISKDREIIFLQKIIYKLQKENKEYQELTDNLRGENAELRDDLDELQNENEKLKEDNKTLCEMAFIRPMPLTYTTPAFTSTDAYISKEKVKNIVNKFVEKLNDLLGE